MADKRIIELEERSTLVNNDFIATDNTNGTAKVNGAILGQKKDSASLALYGSTNTSGSTITSGTFFYLNGNLVKALANIAANASFTLNTNYKVVSIGEELSSLNNDLNTIEDLTITHKSGWERYSESARRYGKVVEVYLFWSAINIITADANRSVLIGNIGTNFNMIKQLVAYDGATGLVSDKYRFYIQTNGDIYFKSTITGTNLSIMGVGTFIQ